MPVPKAFGIVGHPFAQTTWIPAFAGMTANAMRPLIYLIFKHTIRTFGDANPYGTEGSYLD
jgi:hypothetical protein